MLFRLTLLVLLLLDCIRAGAAQPLEAGVAFVDITPPVPFRMSGYFYERLSTGTKDPLQARAIVFKQGDELAALVFCDVIGVPLEISDPARKKASAATGIQVDHIAVVGTHTHTGPLFFTALHDLLHDRAVEQQGDDPHDSGHYRRKLIDKIAEAVAQAKASLAPAEIKSGTAHEDRISFNRRFYMKDGSVRFNPPAQSPDIVRPAGPIDPRIGIVLLNKPGVKQPVSAIVSFAMHLDTTGGTLYSADYVKSLEDRLKRSFGPGFKLLFGTGTCGDINHRDVTKTEQRTADELGGILGDAIASAIENGEVVTASEPALAMKSTKVASPLQSFTADELAHAKAVLPRIGTRELPFLEAVEACKIVDIERLRKRGQDPAQLEVQALRLDRDTALVFLPNEVFVDLGRAIKSQSPFRHTLVVELANDDLAYTPTKQAFAEGSYEITNSRVVPGTGEKLVEAAIGLLKELQ